MRALLPFGVAGLVGLMAMAAVEWLPQTLHYPELRFAASDSLTLRFIKYGKRSDAECRQKLLALRDILAKSCPTCVLEARCVEGLDSEHRVFLSNEAVQMPTARLPDGVVAYASPIDELAVSACKQSELATKSLPERRQVKCHLKGQTPR